MRFVSCALLLMLASCWWHKPPRPAPLPPDVAKRWAWATPLVACGTIDLATAGAAFGPSPDGLAFFDSKTNMIKRLEHTRTVLDIVATESQYAVTELAVGGDRVYWSMMGEYELRTALLRGGAMKPIVLPSKVHSIKGLADGALVLTNAGDLFRVTGEVPAAFVMGRKLKHIAVDGRAIYAEDGTAIYRFSLDDDTLHEIAKTGGPLHEGDQFTARGGIVAWFTTDKALHILRPDRAVISLPGADGLSPRISDNGVVFFVRGLAVYRVRDQAIEVAIDQQGQVADGMFHSFEIEGRRVVVVHDNNLRLFCQG